MPTESPESTKAKRLAFLVRTHEANCKIEHPTEDERNFRLATMKALGLEFNLREVRAVTVSSPSGRSK